MSFLLTQNYYYNYITMTIGFKTPTLTCAMFQVNLLREYYIIILFIACRVRDYKFRVI